MDNLVYISCDHATLAHNVKELCAQDIYAKTGSITNLVGSRVTDVDSRMREAAFGRGEL